MDEEQQRYERAHAKVLAIKGFYIHASAIVVVNIALLASVVVIGSPLTLSSLADDGRAALAEVRLFEETHVRRLSALSSEMKDLPPEDLATVARATDILERLVHVPEHR